MELVYKTPLSDGLTKACLEKIGIKDACLEKAASRGRGGGGGGREDFHYSPPLFDFIILFWTPLKVSSLDAIDFERFAISG